MDVAELYLSLTRPSMVPVVGECVAEGFVGQIQIERWNWNLMNDDEIKRAKKDERDYEAHRDFLVKRGDPNDRQRQADRLNLAMLKIDEAMKSQEKSRSSANESANKERAELSKKFSGAALLDEQKKFDARRDTEDRKTAQDNFKTNEKLRLELKGLNEDLTSADRDYLEDLDKAVGEAANKAQEIERRLKKNDEEAAEANKSYEFSFSKRVDFATTQMLNSMKSGDVFPLAVLTINQRSSNAGMFLVFTVTNLRLLDYNLRCDLTETMTDMKEQWKAEFRSLAYVYKNRRSIESSDDAVEAVSKAATQGTVRTFMMKKDLGI